MLGGIIVIGKDIIEPFAFSLLIAVLLLPFNKFLEKYKVNRVIAILVTLVISLIIFTGILNFLTSQIVDFANEIPAIKAIATSCCSCTEMANG